jgi:hypothetical protein
MVVKMSLRMEEPMFDYPLAQLFDLDLFTSI